MKVINCNVNGIRSALKKKFFTWAKTQKADFICLQEVRAQENQIIGAEFELPGHSSYFIHAKKNGYSGVAIYAKIEPEKIIQGLDIPFIDEEARYLQLDFTKFKLVTIYVPSGTSGELRQNLKYKFLEIYQQILAKQIKEQLPYIICGDFNIAHRNIDIKNWKSNQKHSGFLPEERAWLDLIFVENQSFASQDDWFISELGEEFFGGH